MTRRRLLTAATAAALLATLVIGPLTTASSAGTASSASTAKSASIAKSMGSVVTASNEHGAGAIVVIGTGGLSWSDVSARTTPALWSLLQSGATGTLSVHSVHANTCPVDGWLTLSAGEQAGDVDGHAGKSDRNGGNTVSGGNSAGNGGRNEGDGARPPCRALPERMAAGRVPRWDEYLAAAAATRFAASPGLLGDQVAGHGGCIQAIGPGAALGAARSNGVVDRYQAYDESTLDAALGACPATLVDAGLVRDPADVDPRDEARPATTRARQVAAVDARVAAILKAAPSGTDVVVASLADAGVTGRLRLIAAGGPRFGAGTLESSSTRQPGLVQLADLTPTVLQRLGIAKPAALGGTALGFVPAVKNSVQAADERRRALLDHDQASHEVHSLVEPFFYGWVLLQVALYLVAAVLWRRGWGTGAQRQQLLGLTRRVAIVAATIPVSTFLANLLPWWRFSMPLVSVVASVAVFATAISIPALLGPWRRHLLGPPAVVALATMVVLALDLMTGSRLQISSLLGLQPVVGGRFYGMGNVTFALFGTATLLLCTTVGNHLVTIGRRRTAAAAVAAIGLAALIVDAAPSWGSDFGGPPALLPGLAILILAILEVRLTRLRVLAIVGGTSLFVLVLGLLDWLRPAESRSHLGRFVQTAVDGDAWDIVARKLDQNITLLFGNPLSLLIPVALVLLCYLLARPGSRISAPLQRSFDRVPLLRSGLIAVTVMWVLGFALNDSGTAIPAVGATLAVPLLIAIAVKTLEDERAGWPAEAGTARASRLRR